MKSVFLLALFTAQAVLGATVTLFGFQPHNLPRNAVSLKAAGVGPDGATTYIEEIYQTAVGYGDPQDTNTFTAPTAIRTLHATLVADATLYRYSMLPATAPDGVQAFGVIENCTLDGKGAGGCVALAWEDGGETTTTTFSGPVAPFYTLTIDGGSTTRNGGTRISIPVVLLVLLLGFNSLVEFL
ncbi:hypothetical protein R3P38DRAFT_2858082 [Favolaschia claudopus]|uniref:Uncharacterized protein n=1 Tax=Favolaschia claudopus TaxID=2862362 RepID=A0AAW0DMR1_9AGAR